RHVADAGRRDEECHRRRADSRRRAADRGIRRLRDGREAHPRVASRSAARRRSVSRLTRHIAIVARHRVCPSGTTCLVHQSSAGVAGRSFTVMRFDDGKILRMPARHQATVEDLYQTPGKAELVNGELVLMPFTGGLHGYAVMAIATSLNDY